MKNTAINNISYTGIVTLSQYTNGKKFIIAQKHNAGKHPLFDFLVDCLAGNFELARKNMPSKIMLLKSNKNITDTEVYDSKSQFIFRQTIPEKVNDSEKDKVRYSFVIPRTVLETADFDAIGLYTDSNQCSTATEINDYAAICKLTEENKDSALTMSASTALVIDWELIISN